ncbi:hypothetical protein PHLGIDRAFT_323755 [Phlebiopsis gigantea 11061_1 CR5-6]|uniref:Uncharacterized protein n=1 Tax=Phlebiopsis gigantea (strain 11061_1 CR5-6) TaxID=745531 RepID=A0A0C3S2E5_PHLG1|nr:hypothetical protein PHLGIDRAFT_323755 [Phlebiopsis gigantea 11061_1 CR5-6]
MVSTTNFTLYCTHCAIPTTTPRSITDVRVPHHTGRRDRRRVESTMDRSLCTTALNSMDDAAECGCRSCTWIIHCDCGAMEIVVAAATLLGDLQVAIFSALRVYAIANRNLYFTGSVLLLGLVPIATNLDMQDGLSLYAQVLLAYLITMVTFRLATRASAVAMDILVLGITWTRTFRQWQEARDLKIASPVTTCLLRDGTWYFITLLLLNILQMTLPNESVFASTFVSALLVTLPPILVNRFMINLRSTSSPQSASFEASRIVSQAIFLGNIGEPLARDGEEDGQQRKKRRAASDSMEIASDEEGKQWSASKSGEC